MEQQAKVVRFFKQFPTPHGPRDIKVVRFQHEQFGLRYQSVYRDAAGNLLEVMEMSSLQDTLEIIACHHVKVHGSRWAKAV